MEQTNPVATCPGNCLDFLSPIITIPFIFIMPSMNQVHTLPKILDHVLAAGKPCPKYKALFANYMKQSKEVQRIYTEYADLFPYLSRMTGLNITTITDVYWLYNTLEIERDTNKT